MTDQRLWQVYVKLAGTAGGMQVVVEAEDEAWARRKAKFKASEKLITMACTEIQPDPVETPR